MRTTLILLAAVLAVATAARPDFVRGGRAAPSTMHRIVFWTKIADGVEDSCGTLLFNELSNPKHANYGKWLSHADMSRFANPTSSAAIVYDLHSRGLRNVRLAPNHEFVEVVASIDEFERAFGAEFYEHHVPSQVTVRTLLATTVPLPASLAPHVHTTQGFNQTPKLRAQKPVIMSKFGAAGGLGATGVATPALLWSTYGINNRKVASPQSTNSIFASLDQSFNPKDLVSFQSKYSLPASVVGQVTGPNHPRSCFVDPDNCLEASLDVQQITSTAQLGNTSFWSIPDTASDIFLDWINAVSAASQPPLVHSISYGSLSPEDDAANMYLFNTEVCKMGLRGLTILVASGDDGVANYGARSNASACGFTPSFPASSPYVLAVGASQGPEAGNPEVACTADHGGGITTGSGFSIRFPMPSYQATVVTSYLKNGPNMPPLAMFNSTGRAYPDVAFLGNAYPVYAGGQLGMVSGTSASSPAMAAVVTLINGIRLAAGKSSLGFVNTALYMSNGKGFTDLTVGTNNCCADMSPPVCCQYGFTAAPGWDAVTGWGSPNFPVLSSYWASL